MTTIKETAQAYEPPQTTKNIADLDKVNVTEEIKVEVLNEGKENEWTQHFIVRDGRKYVVKNSVLEQLKTYLEVNPKMTHFRVIKKGSGMETKYTVVLLGE